MKLSIVRAEHAPAEDGKHPDVQGSRPQFYLRVPERLLRACAHDPLAVGVYLAVARCVVAERRATPLSAADLALWGGNPHGRASVMRRIRWLLDANWLVAERGGNVKLLLLPTWGVDRNERTQPWHPSETQHGRPHEVRVRRVPLDLLDVYMGRLDPQPGRRAAVVTRYFDRTLLNLGELGAYALASAIAVPCTERLADLGLTTATGLREPRAIAELLAAADAGELRLNDAGVIVVVRPSAFGRRQLAIQADKAMSSERSANESRSEARSGSVSESGSESSIADLHGSNPPVPERHPAVLRERPAPYAWDSWDRRTHAGMDFPPPHAGERTGGQRPDHKCDCDAKKRNLTPAASEALLALGVRHPESLGGIDAAFVTRWREALAHPGFAARFTDPVAFAVTQMKRRNEPPNEDQLARWVAQERRASGRNSPQLIDPPGQCLDDEHHRALVAHAQKIAPLDATPTHIALLLQALATGASDEKAIAELEARAASDVAAAQDEEVYRALIARSARR